MPFFVATNLTFERIHWRNASSGLGLFLQLLGQIGKLLHLAAVHRLEQGLARREMAVKRADADAGGLRDGFEAGIRATGAEHDFRSFENTFAVPHGVGARLSCRLLRLISDAGRHISTP